MSEQASQPKKKPYVAPELRRVKLEPQNVVLGICKNGGGAGPGGTCSNAPVCSEIGS